VNRTEKTEMVELLGNVFEQSGSVVVARYVGMSVAEMTQLRVELKAAGATFKVTKNRLAKIALENAEVPGAGDMFVEPTGIAYSDDPVAAPKVLTKFAKTNNKLVIVGGILGQSTLDAKAVEALSKMPSIEEMRAKLLGVLNEPGNKLARTLNEPGNKLARQLNAPGSNLVGVLLAHKAKLEQA